MEYPPLVLTEDLPTGSGAPSQDDLDIIGEDVRAYCGWHIAPEITETIIMDSSGAEALILPTLKLSDVVSVESWNGAEYRPLGGWDPHRGWSAESVSIHRSGGFPVGKRALRVTMVHGYTVVPKSLVKGLVRLLAGPGAADVASESLPGHAITFRGTTAYTETAGLLASSGSLARYRRGPRP